MAAQPSSSHEIIQEPFNPQLEPVIYIQSNSPFISIKKTMPFEDSGLRLHIERIIDFESLRVNKKDVGKILLNQQWNSYFEMLNGPTYTDLVKQFWMRAMVFDKKSADNQEAIFRAKNPRAAGYNMKQMKLEPFLRTDITSDLFGMNVVITQEHIAKLLKLDNTGEVISNYKTAKTFH
jgi:hypothetical protein